MAHEIETFDDGTAAFFTARTGRLAPTRHRHPRLPHRRTSHDHRLPRRLERPHRPAHRHRHRRRTGSPPSPVTDHYATVRTHPVTGRPDVLGVVGADYTVVQNEQHGEMLNLLVDEAGAHFETAGSLRDGPGDVRDHETPEHPHPRPAPTARTTTSTCTSPPCPATTAPPRWRVIVTPIRIVCANTQRVALPTAKAHYAIRHTRNANGPRSPKPARPSGIMWRYCDSLRDRRPDTDQRDARAGRVPDRSSTSCGRHQRPHRPRARAAGIPTAATPPCADLFPDADTQHAIRGTRWAGCRPSPNTSTTTHPPRTTQSGPPGS